MNQDLLGEVADSSSGSENVQCEPEMAFYTRNPRSFKDY